MKASELIGKGLQHDNVTKARGFVLREHIAECVEQHRFLSEDTAIYGQTFVQRLAWLMGIESQSDRIVRISRLATILHDLGKAGSEFQEMMWGVVQSQQAKAAGLPDKGERKVQSIRHERVSYWWVRQRLWDWTIAQLGSEHDAWLCVSAVVGHHIKTDKVAKEGKKITLYGQALSQTVNGLLRAHGLQEIALKDECLFPFEMDEGLKCQDEPSDWGWDEHSQEEQKVLLACRWLVILADTLGSIDYPKEGRAGWTRRLQQMLRQAWSPRQIDYRTDEYIKDYSRISGTLRDFQKEARDIEGNMLLTAGCGGGKTTAALLWAQPNTPLVFALPTTGTASQLHLEYGRGSAFIGNRHGRSDVDAELTTESLNSAYESHGDEARQEQEEDIQVVKDLQALQDNLTYCTIDQVVGLLGNYRKSVLWLLHLVRCQLVVDEAHALDSMLQTNLNKFRMLFPRLRMAVMSASLAPQVRELYTKDTLGEPFIWVRAQGPEFVAPRYRFVEITEEDASKYFTPGTLWIVNRVAKSQDIAKEHLDSHILHSRYRYVDRKQKQADFIRDFKVCPDNTRGVATQVAEMSFDISARQMIMAGCPPEAIVQRLGRLNRYLEQPVGVCYFYPTDPEKALPYSEGDLKRGHQFMKSLEGRDFSQQDLEAALESTLADQDVWDGGYLNFNPKECAKKNVRKESIPSASVLLKSDALTIGKFPKTSTVQRYEITIPVAESLASTLEICEKIKYRPVLPWYAEYDERLGLDMNSLKRN